MLAWLRMIGWVLFAGIFFFSMRRPRLLRMGLGLFRRRWPIFKNPVTTYGATYLVSRADDSTEVLARAQDFLLGPVNERKILTGDFVIALDPERRYLQERDNIIRALPDDRLTLLEGIVDAEANARLPALIGRPINVPLFSEYVTVAIIRHFWGLNPDAAESRVVYAPRGVDTMRLWVRKLAIVLGSMDPAPFGIREVGLQCSEEFLSYVRAECAVHPPGNRDMIAHILRESGGNRDETVRSIAGLIMTGAAVVTKAFTHAFDQLLDRPEPLELARVAAVQARAAGNAPAARAQRMFVGRLIVEALRFNPVFPVLPRYAVRSTTLARGTPRETEIPAGSNVIVSPLTAMFDPEVMPDPERFGYARNIQMNRQSSTEDWDYGNARDDTPGDYMLFGGGEHWCLGEQMAIAELASMAVALLSRMPRPYKADAVRYDGSAAVSLLAGSR